VVAGSAGVLLLTAARSYSVQDPSTEPGNLLDTLAGKQPLIRRSFRPPNFETQPADLRAAFTPNDRFFVRYHLADIPELDPRAWRLKVGGASAERSIELSLDELERGFERVTIAAINQCSGNRRGLFAPRAGGIQWGYGAMGNATWGGVRLRDVLQRAGIKADALEVVLDGADRAVLPATPDFVKSLPVERALDENTLIAFEMNGARLPHWNGAPVRLVVPGWTATYWVKHLTDVRIEPRAFDGFWMKTAYRIPTGAFPGARFATQENAENTPITEILINSMVTSHVNGARLTRGPGADLSGWAWDGGSGIRTVEVSTDDGRSWRSATLGKDLGRFSWRGFSFRLDTSAPGPMSVAVRATSRAGARQPEQLTPNPSGYHHNIIQRLALEVA
jgi:DMSO/TMAO reductase YedYZ molybdopterin-dependent catalytic subunit